MRAAAPANITLLSGKEYYPFPDNKRMQLYRFENQLDFLFLTNIASIQYTTFQTQLVYMLHQCSNMFYRKILFLFYQKN